MKKQNISITYGENKKFEAYTVAPESDQKMPGLIIIEEIWGLNDHVKNVCDRFAAEGYVVLSPELLGELGIVEKIAASQAKGQNIQADLFGSDMEKKHAAQAAVREMMQPAWSPDFAAGAMAKLAAAFEHLMKDPRVNGDIAVMGFCFGGTYSFNLAVTEPRLKGAVILYGQAPDPVSLVEKITCPVLNLCGEKDERVVTALPALTEAMKKYGKDFTSKVYPGVGHAFFNDTNPIAYNAAAAKDAWNMTLAFLNKCF